MKQHENSVVRIPSTFVDAVDLIVAFHGQYDKVTNLIESIFKLTRSNYYHLYLVDDFSPNSDFIKRIDHNARKRNITNIKTLRCSTQRGFGGACQAAFERSENPYVCFVNSDCLVEDINWLRAMGETLVKLKPQSVRMVSARTNNPVNGDPSQKGQKGISSEDVILGEDSYLSLYCFMCHRELFTRCGGFLKNYKFGYEDEEFAHRMKRGGFRQAVSGKSWIYHEGSATLNAISKKTGPKIKALIEGDRNQCIQDMQKF